MAVFPLVIGDPHPSYHTHLDNEVELSDCSGVHSYSKYTLQAQFERDYKRWNGLQPRTRLGSALNVETL